MNNLYTMTTEELVNLIRDTKGLMDPSIRPEFISYFNRLWDNTLPKEQTYQVQLVNPGDKMINCIKEIRAVTGLGLKEAKDFVDEFYLPREDNDWNVPRKLLQMSKVIVDNLTKQEAQEIVNKFINIGARAVLMVD